MVYAAALISHVSERQRMRDLMDAIEVANMFGPWESDSHFGDRNCYTSAAIRLTAA